MQFIKPNRCKVYIHGKGRRVSRSFLAALDAFVQDRMDAACRLHNGSTKTLTGELAQFVLVRHR